MKANREFASIPEAGTLRFLFHRQWLHLVGHRIHAASDRRPDLDLGRGHRERRNRGSAALV
jgi:hypothetical protein